MIIQKLDSHLKDAMTDASEICIAVALITSGGIELITNPSLSGQRKILVGIDLPTPPAILLKLLDLAKKYPALYQVKIANRSKIFHPKVYLLRYKDKTNTAFIGSGNATNGGFTSNVEMTVKIDDVESCKQIQNWFDGEFLKGTELAETFIKRYEAVFLKNRKWVSAQRSNNEQFKREFIDDNSLTRTTVDSRQFFTQSDFDAFHPDHHYSELNNIKAERKAVRNKFIALGEMILPFFKEYGIDNLKAPPKKSMRVSFSSHTGRNKHQPVDAMWLHYGKSEEELQHSNNSKFAENMRIQVILRRTESEAYIGIWLFIGKPRNSLYDRSYIRSEIRNEQFQLLLFEYLIELGGSYYIQNAGRRLDLSQIDNANDLLEFFERDDYSDYYRISRDYDFNATELSSSEIAETVLTEFSKLNKIYKLFQH